MNKTETESEFELLLNGDSHTFDNFVIKNREKCVMFALNLVKDYYTAEDIVQDSFAVFFVYKERLKNYSSAKTYLFSIIHNKAIDYIRKNNKTLSFDYIESTCTLSPEYMVLKKEKNKNITKNFKQLNDNYKKTLYLYVFENMSYKEIADTLNKSLVQIKITIFRARKKLKKLCSENYA